MSADLWSTTLMATKKSRFYPNTDIENFALVDTTPKIVGHTPLQGSKQHGHSLLRKDLQSGIQTLLYNLFASFLRLSPHFTFVSPCNYAFLKFLPFNQFLSLKLSVMEVLNITTYSLFLLLYRFISQFAAMMLLNRLADAMVHFAAVPLPSSQTFSSAKPHDLMKLHQTARPSLLSLLV